MNYLSLKLYLLLALLATSGFLCALALSHDMIPQAVLLLISACIAVAMTISLFSRLKTVVSTFFLALEAGDTTISFSAKGDRDLQKMGNSINNISTLYATAIRDRQTHKLYYDRILRVMTHEIRNDLSPIISLSKEMAHDPQSFSNEQMSEAMELIASQSMGLKRFLDSYYELTHIPTPEIHEVDVFEFLHNLRTAQLPFAKDSGLPSGSLRFISPVELKVSFDSALIARALSNIIRNAIEAVAGSENPEVTVTASLSDNVFFFTVHDNGGGFSHEASEHLFTPFYTTKSEGSGIGLSLSRQIALLHNGDLQIASYPGKGTSVTLTLTTFHTQLSHQ